MFFFGGPGGSESFFDSWFSFCCLVSGSPVFFSLKVGMRFNGFVVGSTEWLPRWIQCKRVSSGFYVLSGFYFRFIGSLAHIHLTTRYEWVLLGFIGFYRIFLGLDLGVIEFY